MLSGGGATEREGSPLLLRKLALELSPIFRHSLSLVGSVQKPEAKQSVSIFDKTFSVQLFSRK